MTLLWFRLGRWIPTILKTWKCARPASATQHADSQQAPLAGQGCAQVRRSLDADHLQAREASVTCRFAGDATDVYSLTEAECRLREDVFRLVALLKENFEEFRNCYIIDTGTQVGIRETRRIDGLYEMTADDILSPKDFPTLLPRAGTLSIYISPTAASRT